MKCVICRKGDTVFGETTVTLDRNGTTIVFQDVPAQVCDNCGEEYIDASISERLLREADAAARAGVTVEVRRYAAA